MNLGRAVGLIVSASALLGVAGCSVATASDPREQLVAAALQSATSSFERAVLKDGEVSRAEYEEATQRYVDCMRVAGWDISQSDQGGVYGYSVVGKAEGPAWDNTDGECKEGNSLLISPLYVDHFSPIAGQTTIDTLAACLVENDVVDEPFTGEDLARYLPDAGTGTAEETAPWDPEDPAVMDCLAG